MNLIYLFFFYIKHFIYYFITNYYCYYILLLLYYVIIVLEKYPGRFRRILLNGLANEIETRPNVNGMTKFHFACVMGYPLIVCSKLDFETDIVDAQVDSVVGAWGGYAPLHFAVRFNQYKILDLLLKYVPEFEVRNAKGLTPLHLAVLLKNEKIVTRLLREKADPNSVISGHPSE